MHCDKLFSCRANCTFLKKKKKKEKKKKKSSTKIRVPLVSGVEGNATDLRTAFCFAMHKNPFI